MDDNYKIDIVAASYGTFIVTDTVRTLLANATSPALTSHSWSFGNFNTTLGDNNVGQAKYLTIVWRVYMTSLEKQAYPFSDFMVYRGIETQQCVLTFDPAALKQYKLPSPLPSSGVVIVNASRGDMDVTADAIQVLQTADRTQPNAEFIDFHGLQIGTNNNQMVPNFVLTYAYVHEDDSLVVEMKAKWDVELVSIRRGSGSRLSLSPGFDIVSATWGEQDVTYTVRQVYQSHKLRIGGAWNFVPWISLLVDPAFGKVKAFVIVWRAIVGNITSDQPLFSPFYVTRILDGGSITLDPVDWPGRRRGLANFDLLTLNDLPSNWIFLIDATYMKWDVSTLVRAKLGPSGSPKTPEISMQNILDLKGNQAGLTDDQRALILTITMVDHCQSYQMTYAQRNTDGGVSITTKADLWSNPFTVDPRSKSPRLTVLSAIWANTDFTTQVSKLITKDQTLTIDMAKWKEYQWVDPSPGQAKTMNVMYRWDGRSRELMSIPDNASATASPSGPTDDGHKLTYLDHYNAAWQQDSGRFFDMASAWANTSPGAPSLGTTYNIRFMSLGPDSKVIGEGNFPEAESVPTTRTNVSSLLVRLGVSSVYSTLSWIREITSASRLPTDLGQTMSIALDRMDSYLVWALEDTTWKDSKGFWDLLFHQIAASMPAGDPSGLTPLIIRAYFLLMVRIENDMAGAGYDNTTPECKRVARLLARLALSNANFQQQVLNDDIHVNTWPLESMVAVAIRVDNPLYRTVTDLALTVNFNHGTNTPRFRNEVLNSGWFDDVIVNWVLPTAVAPWGNLYQVPVTSLLAKNISTIVPDPRDAPQAKALEFLKGVCRIFVCCNGMDPLPDIVGTIVAGYLSAHHIGGTPEQVFISDVMSTSAKLWGNLAQSEDRLKLLSAHAQVVRARNQRLSMAMAHFVRGSGIAACDDFTSISERENVLEGLIKIGDPSSDIKMADVVFEIDDYQDTDSLSVTGPAAYLVEILNFLPRDVRARLFEKRPDIANVELTNENTTVELPYIDLANEVMESYIQNLNKQSPNSSIITAYNTAPDSESAELVEAPQNVANAVYQTLQQSPSPFTSLPFNLGLAKQRAYLSLLKTSRHELLWMFRDESKYRSVSGATAPVSSDTASSLKQAQIEVVRRATNAETLGLSHADFAIITKESYWSQPTWALQQVDSQTYGASIGLPDIWTTWGYASKDDMLNTDVSRPDNRKGLFYCTEAFIPRSGLSLTDYEKLANTSFVGSLINHGTSPSWSGIDPGTMLHTLAVDADGWDRIQAFLRLAKRSGFSFEELDEAIRALSNVNDNVHPFTPSFIADLATLKRIMVSTGIDMLTLLNIFEPMSVVGNRSLYSRLFMKRSILRLDTAFVDPTSTQAPPLRDHLAVLLGAVSCTPAAFVAISRGLPGPLQSPDNWQTLSLVNIQLSYRCVSLAQLTNIPAEQICTFFNVFPQCFASPHELERSLKLWKVLSDAGLTIAQLWKILDTTNPQVATASDSEVAALKVLSSLHSDLEAAQTKYPAQISTILTTEELKHLSCSVLSTEVVAVYFQILSQKVSGAAPAIHADVVNDSKFQSVLPSNVEFFPQVGNQPATLILTGLLSQDGVAATTAYFVDRGADSTLSRSVTSELSSKASNQASLTLQTLSVSQRSPDFEVILLSGDDTTHAAALTKIARLQTYLFTVLRTSLEHKALSTAFGPTLKSCDEEMLSFLLDSIVALQPGTNVVESLRRHYTAQKPASTESKPWSGYFNPPSTGDFIFTSQVQQQKDLLIDGRSYAWSQDSSSLEWFSQPVSLSARNFYPVIASTGSIAYRVLNAPLLATVTTSFVSSETLRKVQNLLMVLQRIDLLIGAFGLTLDELAFLLGHQRDIGIDPLKPKVDDLIKISIISNARGTSQGIRKSSLQNPLIEIVKWATRAQTSLQADGASQISDTVTQINAITGWDDAVVGILLTVVTANRGKNDLTLALRDFTVLKRLFGLIGIVKRFDIDPTTLRMIFDLAQPVSDMKTATYDMDVADGVAKILRTRFGSDAWDQMIGPLNNNLRQQRRDALIAYLLQQDQIKGQGVTDANGLFEFFLIDVQMGTSLTTSRVKQATAVVQLFVHRALLGMETNQDKSPLVIDADGWQNISKYRVWEASVKIQLFPENWLNASLLDVKSPMFETIQSTIKQGSITWDSAQVALQEYLHGLNDIAHLQYLAHCSSGPIQPGATEPETLHVFARTQGSPPKFYYRRKHINLGWDVWQLMDVQVSVYESDRSHGSAQQSASERVHGSFVLPIAVNSRLFVFLPQFTKVQWYGKRPYVNSSTPAPRNMTWHITFNWSEYRNYKWTQPKALTASVSDYALGPSGQVPLTDPPPIETYAFRTIPSPANHITIEIMKQFWWGNSDSVVPTGTFHYLCSVGHVTIDTTNFVSGADTKTSWGPEDSVLLGAIGKDAAVKSPMSFHQREDGSIYHSEQSVVGMPQPDIFNATDIFSTDTTRTSRMVSGGQTQTLVYPESSGLVEKSMSSGAALDAILSVGASFSNSADRYSPLSSLYSGYIWEMAVFIPMLLVDSFLDAQQFDNALKVIRYVFNPLATTVSGIWPFGPFNELAKIASPDVTLKILLTQDDSIKPVESTAFDPHAVARTRVTAYMRWVVMKYIQILTMYGDYCFRQNTLESLPEAIQFYIEAAHLLGPQENLIQQKRKRLPATYATLQGNEFNFVVDFETSYPHLSAILDTTTETTDTVSLAYFGIVHNDQIAVMKDTVADRSFKIRNSMDISGNVRTLALYEPAIDPGFLVQAATAGSLNLSNTLSGLDAPLVHVRFSKLLQNALDICYDLRLFWASLLAAKQSKDAEALIALQAQQSSSTQSLALKMKELAVEQAQKAIDALVESRKEPDGKLRHFSQLLGLGGGEDIVPKQGETFVELDYYAGDFGAVEQRYGMNQLERNASSMDAAAMALRGTANVPIISASIVALFPELTASEAPLGVGAHETEGGKAITENLKAIAEVISNIVETISMTSEIAKQNAEYQNRFVERKLEYNEAGAALMAIDQQIEIQKIVLELAEQDLANQKQSIEAAAAMEAFLKSKYTNSELYLWMQNTLQDLYYQTYTLVYDIAQKAERVYRFERGIDPATPKIIDFGYWDINQAGALAGEKIYVGLRKLQQAYDQTRGHDFEIKKQISLRQIDPLALYDLRATGSCTFWIPEIMFDMDFPGQYKRRIKAVSLSLPTSDGGQVSATLTLMEHKYRTSNNTTTGYFEAAGGLDARFRKDDIPILAIAVSDPTTEDAGVFNLDFGGDTIFPFEGAGAISKWSLEISQFSELDPASITNVMIHMQYTSSNGAGPFKDTVIATLNQTMTDQSNNSLTALFDLRTDFPSTQTWTTATDNTKELSLKGLPALFPFFTRSSTAGGKIKIAAAYLITKFGSTAGVDNHPIKIALAQQQTNFTASFNVISDGSTSGSLTKWAANLTSPVTLSSKGVEKDSITLQITGYDIPATESVWLVVQYALGR